MGSSFVICDKEDGYAAALAAFLMKKKELAFQIQVCSTVKQAEAVAKERAVDILLISEDIPIQERRKIGAENVFVLTESKRTRTGEGEFFLYRYQSGESLLAEVIQNCGRELKTTGELFLKKQNQKVRVIGIYSPVHRTGRTSYALRLGQETAAVANTLYMNMELYGGTGGHFPIEGSTVADALYYSRMEGGELGWMLTSMVSHMGALDYLLPARVSEDMKGVPAKDWENLLRQILTEGSYEVVILDLDEGIQGVYELLRMCTEIHMPVGGDKIAESKISQFEEEMHLLGYDDLRRKIQKKEFLR